MDSWSDRIDTARKQRELEGEAKYGPINPVNDSRCFIQEAHEELLDSLNYLEWAMEKGEMGFCKWYLIDRELRFTITRLLAARRIGELLSQTERARPAVGSKVIGDRRVPMKDEERPTLSDLGLSKLVEDLSGKVENLLFVIWIQDQRHDYWMKFIKEVRIALEILREGDRGWRQPELGM
jgi:hypothetical protein